MTPPNPEIAAPPGLRLTAVIIRASVSLVTYCLVWCLSLTLAWIVQKYFSVWNSYSFNKSLEYLAQGIPGSFAAAIGYSYYDGIFAIFSLLHLILVFVMEAITGASGRGLILHSLVAGIILGMGGAYLFYFHGPSSIGTFTQPGQQFAIPVIAASLIAGLSFGRMFSILQPRDTRYGC